MSLHEDRPGGAATHGLEAEGPGAGEEIQGDRPANARAHEVEEGLADAVFHGPRPAVRHELEPPAPEVAADDPRGAGGFFGGGGGLSGRMMSGHELFLLERRSLTVGAFLPCSGGL
jgi:hypothetical protein